MKRRLAIFRKGDVALSIGGDNYCYADVQRYIMMHDMLLQRGAKTVLWGCSVETRTSKGPCHRTGYFSVQPYRST